jgi:hypothetical protein
LLESPQILKKLRENNPSLATSEIGVCLLVQHEKRMRTPTLRPLKNKFLQRMLGRLQVLQYIFFIAQISRVFEISIQETKP